MIAIDLGSSSGAIVHDRRGTLQVDNMPETPEGIWQYFYVLVGMWRMDSQVCPVVMEDVGHGFPGNSSKSMFTFAKHRGHLDMTVIGMGLQDQLTVVLPSVWMHELYGDRLPSGRKKADKKKRKDYIWADMVRRYPSFRVTKRNADAFALYTWATERRERL